ncbi:MAG: ATP-dependent Clp protease proteolytic subunit [Chloroflexota bacterium]|nr:ATP-dependent Clp protease proteolytic subunit [Chloroflexota bacterium]
MEAPRLDDLLRNYSERRAELDRMGAYFLGSIDEAEAERCSKTLLLLAIERREERAEDRPLTLYINSAGGAVGAGLAIIEMVARVRRQYDVQVNTVITGYAYSMGAIVFQCGQTRSMGRYSTMMLHGARWTLSGEEERIFKDYLKLANHYQALIGGLFARRTGRQTAEWWADFIYGGGDKFLSAAECRELGLVDEIVEDDFGM